MALLRELIQPASLERCGDRSFPVLSMTMHDGIMLQSDRFKKSLASVDQSAYKVVRRNQLVVGFPIDEGVLYIQQVADAGIMSPAYDVWNVDETKVNLQYFELCLHSPQSMMFYRTNLRGTTARRRSLPKETLLSLPVPVPSMERQREIASTIARLKELIELRQRQLRTLDTLIKARFVEMFGDFKTNPMGWQVVSFEEIAVIDGNMTTDYERYADYPHIGIDSIEKDTGLLKGYRTVAEDGVISGKYIFTPAHIIYSKIRPNLNKVALPDFDGLCSADAYPILPFAGKCNRVFLAYDMRSTFFLDYILQFCNRTNLPKVNRKEVAGFRTPLPPIQLQDQFAAFVSHVDKSKVVAPWLKPMRQMNYLLPEDSRARNRIIYSDVFSKSVFLETGRVA